MKKGFTLIELLAVIVILAIIAVIAVPIVLNIINDAKDSATLRSADFYLRGLETSIATSILNNIQVPDGKHFIMQNGNVCIGKLSNNTCDGDILKVEMNGEKPIKGYITISNGQVTNLKFNYDNNVVIKEDNGTLAYQKTLSELAVVSSDLGVNSIENCTKKGQICEIDEDGVSFAIKVNDTETYKFYVIADDGNTVKLIMASDLGELVAWDDYLYIEYEDGEELGRWRSNSRGPLTALGTLKQRTSTWTNLEEYSYTLNYGIVYGDEWNEVADDWNKVEGVYSGEYVQNVRARLPKIDDINSFGVWNEDEGEEVLPTWLREGATPHTWLYWFSDANSENSEQACGVFYAGMIWCDYGIELDMGLRPVIAITK